MPGAPGRKGIGLVEEPRIAYYAQETPHAARGFDLPSFVSQTRSPAAEPTKPSLDGGGGQFWSALRGCLASGQAPARGVSHLIAVCPTDPGACPDPEVIVAAALAARVSVQVVAAARNAALEDLCRGSGGYFRMPSPEDNWDRTVEDARLTVTARFAIICQPVSANAKTLQIRLSNDTGWGETNLTL
jgi:hypothetical protein